MSTFGQLWLGALHAVAPVRQGPLEAVVVEAELGVWLRGLALQRHVPGAAALFGLVEHGLGGELLVHLRLSCSGGGSNGSSGGPRRALEPVLPVDLERIVGGRGRHVGGVARAHAVAVDGCRRGVHHQGAG